MRTDPPDLLTWTIMAFTAGLVAGVLGAIIHWTP